MFDQHQMIYLFDRNTKNLVALAVLFAFFRFISFYDQLLSIPRKSQLRKIDATTSVNIAAKNNFCSVEKKMCTIILPRRIYNN